MSFREAEKINHGLREVVLGEEEEAGGVKIVLYEGEQRRQDTRVVDLTVL